MDGQKQAEIISVGTELLRGEINDTNAGYLASELPLLGIEVHAISAVGDDLEKLCQLLRQALERSDLVITGGGLGPTEDDLTRECIAAVLGEELAVDPELENQLTALFTRMGRDMPSTNIKQASLIPSAVSLPNRRGTAPGWWVEKNGRVIVALPGPPREMQTMWVNEVVPRLRSRFPGEAILSRTIKTFVISEAKVAELVQPFFESTNPSLGIYSKPDGIQLRLIAHGDNAEQLLDTAEVELEKLFEEYLWGKGDDTLEGTVCGWLRMKELTLATMEDGSSGWLASIISRDGTNTYCYRGGLIACQSGTKVSWGVPAKIIEEYGAISAEVAEAMAIAARDRFSADFGLSTTAIAAADNNEGKQPGLAFIGIADAWGTRTWQQNFLPYRRDNNNRAAIAALFRLRERMMELKLAAL